MSLPEDVITALLSSVRRCPVKIEWLDWDENVTGEYQAYAVAGSLTFDTGQDVRRSFTLTIENSSKLFIPNESLTNQGVKVRIKRGIMVNGIPYWWSRGVYVLTDPSAVNHGGEKLVTLNGLSKWALFDGTIGGRITETTTIAAGTNIGTAMQTLFGLRNETKFNFDATGEVTPYTMTKEPGATIAEFLKELALIPSWELFNNVDGYWRFRPMVDASQKQIVADFTEEELAIYTACFWFSVERTYRPCYCSGTYSPEWSRILNKIKVIGYTDPSTGVTYSGSYSLPSEHRYSADNIGERSDVLNFPELTSNDLCATRAGYEVKQRLKSIDRSSHELILLPFLTELDCVQLENTDAGIANAKYEIQSITEDLTNSNQTIEAWEVS